MSLINQVLKDIDKRQGSVPPAFTAADGIQGLETSNRSSGTGTLVLLGLGAILAAGAYLYWPRPSAPAAAPKPAVAAAPAEAAPLNPVKSVSAEQPVEAKPQVQAAASQPVVAAVVPPTPLTPPAAAVPVASHQPVRVKSEAAPAPAPMPVSMPVTPAPARETGVQIQPVAKADAASGSVARVISPEQRADNAYREALGLMRQGRMAEGQRLLQKVLADYPAQHDARQLLARSWLESGQYVEAKALLNEGLAMAPQHREFYMAMAHAQMQTNEPDAAIATLERGLPVAGDNAQYHALLAAMVQQKGRHEQAIQHYVIALRQVPDTPSWLVGLGVSLQAQNNLNGAAEAYQRAIDLGLPTSLAQFAQERLRQISR